MSAGQSSYLCAVSASHIFATRYSHFEDWKVGVIAFKIERQTHLTFWCKMDTTSPEWNRFITWFSFQTVKRNLPALVTTLHNIKIFKLKLRASLDVINKIKIYTTGYFKIKIFYNVQNGSTFYTLWVSNKKNPENRCLLETDCDFILTYSERVATRSEPSPVLCTNIISTYLPTSR